MNNDKSLTVILGAFTNKDTCLGIFEIIRNAQMMSPEELMNNMENCFWSYILQTWTEESSGNVLLCKLMYIREKERDRTWLSLRNNQDRIFPMDNRYMSNLFEYTKEGQVIKIYDND